MSGITEEPVMTSEWVVAELRKAILRGELLPGEHVRQEVWAERLGISRVPIREALKTLNTQRLLTHDANRGYFVTKLSMAELAQVYRIRRFFEPAVLESIRWPTEAELARFSEMVERLVRYARSSHVDLSLFEERDFFFALYDLSPLDIFVAEAKHFWDLSDPYRAGALITRRMVDPDATMLNENRHRVLDALRNHDRAALVEQVVSERNSLIAFFDRQSAGADDPEAHLLGEIEPNSAVTR